MAVQWDYVPQRPLALRLRDEMHRLGGTFEVWEAEPQPGTGARAVDESGADGYVAQAETPRDWQAIVAAFRAEYPVLPAAVITTFGGVGALNSGGYDPTVAEPIIEAGFHCLTESYQNANPPSTPANMDWVATQKLGWPRSQPAIGVWGDYPAAAYDLAGFPDYWVWLAETLTSADWQTLRDLNT